MRLAFVLFNYFPFGGLQKNCMNIAKACRDRGHEVEFFTTKWDAELPDWAPVHLLPLRGFTNHSRGSFFFRSLQKSLKSLPEYNGVIGFNRMPGLDVYYAADVCFKEKSRQRYGVWYQFTPRYRHYTGFESAIYSQSAKTQILLVADKQKAHFVEHYQTPENRFHLLPPGISEACKADARAASIRASKRRELDLKESDRAVFVIGSGFKTKGVDRAIQTISGLSASIKKNVNLFIVGEGNFAEYTKMAENLGLSGQVHHLGGRNDVPDLLQAADGLMHPAYSENTGNVILEAIVAGLPVLATDICGYSHYISDADAGLVHTTPWDTKIAAAELAQLLTSERRQQWRENGIKLGQQNDFYHRAEFAAKIIEETCQR